MVATAVVSSVLAHQGGWDEILLVAAPVAVIAGLLAIAKRRVDRAESRATEAQSAGSASADSTSAQPGSAESAGAHPFDAGTDGP